MLFIIPMSTKEEIPKGKKVSKAPVKAPEQAVKTESDTKSAVPGKTPAPA